MTSRAASCRCGQLTATVTGEPVRTSVCHCLDCQRRSGSAFALQARWPAERVTFAGSAKQWTRNNSSGTGATFRFCPECGTEIAYELDSDPGMIAIPVGTFADPSFARPLYSVFEQRRHPWLEIVGEGIDHYD